MDLKNLYKPVNRSLKQTEKYLFQFEKGFSKLVTPKNRNKLISLTNGKKLRAALLLMSAGAGAQTKEAQKVAAIIELLHFASLVHDDILDQEQERRGASPLYRQFSTGKALLLGDYMMARALHFIPEKNHSLIIKTLLNTIATMCEGEIKQLSTQKKLSINKKDYYDNIKRKSAALFAQTCFIGASYNPKAKADLKAFEKYGQHFGIAFQILDDSFEIINFLKNKISKSRQLDINRGNISLPYILLYEASKKDPKIKNLTIKAITNRSSLKKLHQQIIAKNILKKTAQLVNKEVTTAVNSIAGIADKSARNYLLNISSYLTRQSKKMLDFSS